MARLWKAWQATVRGSADLLAGLDRDDDSREEYPYGPHYKVLDGMTGHLTQWINALAVPAMERYRAVGMLGDDVVPRTEGWDVKIMEALGKTPFAFGNDLESPMLRPEGTLCTHVFMRSEVVGRLGYFVPEIMEHTWIDVAWMTWGHACGITYCSDVILEHMHFLTGKGIPDESYMRSRAGLDQGRLALCEYVDSGAVNVDIAKIDPDAPTYTPDEFFQLHHEKGLW